MRRAGIVLAALMAATAAVAQTPPAEDAVRRANDREVAAFIASDTTTLAALWSDEFIVTNPLNRLLAKPRVLAMTASHFVAMSALTRSIDYIRVYGPMTIVAGSEVVTWAGTFPLAGQTSMLRFTAVWRNENGTWREIVRHANIVSPAPQP